MRIAGSASPCRTPTVYSPSLIQRSAITTGSSAEAVRQAAGNSAACSTRLIPTLEPWVAGFTASGRPSSATARSKSAAPASSIHAGVATPAAWARRLVRSLSMPMAEPSTPLPVYGRPIHSSAPCTAPSSPPGPCNAMNTRSNPAGTSSASARSPGSKADASTPRATSASSTALPVISETSRSADAPPISTATRPNSAAFGTRRNSTPAERSRLMTHAPASCRVGARARRPAVLLARAAGTYALARRLPDTVPRAGRRLWPARTRRRGAREQTRKFRRSLRARHPAGSRSRRRLSPRRPVCEPA